MKILHTADWHLGKKLEGYPRHQEQVEVMDEICMIAGKYGVDAVVIAGDIFDTYNPPTESTELFYKTVKRLSANATRPVIVIAGNHDSPDRIEAPDPLAIENGIFLLGYPGSEIKPVRLESGLEVLRSEPGFLEIYIPSVRKALRVIFTPFANEHRLRKALGQENPEKELKSLLSDRWHELAARYCDGEGANILVSHNFFVREGQKAIEDDDAEKPILYVGGAQAIETGLIPAAIQYTALGHLHSYQNLGEDNKPVVYSGSPIAYSFAEAGQDKYVAIAEFTFCKKPVVTRVKLEKGKKLVKRKFDNVDEAVAWLNENPGILLELTIVTGEYLSSYDRKRLYAAHDGIITIIPEIKNAGTSIDSSPVIDMEQSMEKLFEDYFEYKKGQKPNKRLKQLFKELIK